MKNQIIIVNSKSKTVRVKNDTRSELATAKDNLQRLAKEERELKVQLFVLQTKTDQAELMRNQYEKQVKDLTNKLLDEHTK